MSRWPEKGFGRRRRLGALALVLALGTLLVSPAGAHVNGNVKHVWGKHFKPLALKLFYTKAQADARYPSRAEADARYYPRAESDTRYPTRAEADGRYYTKGDADGRYYTRAQADALFAPSGQTASDFQDYCTRALAFPRSYPSSLCTASLTVTLDSGGVVGEFAAVAIGADGFPIVSYRDTTNGDLKILHCGNAVCTGGNAGGAVDTSATSVGTDTAIAIGRDGLAFVSYRDATNDSLRILHCGDVTCSTGNSATTVDTGLVGEDSSIAIGDDGLPVVSYYDASAGDLKVLHCGNAACTAGNTATSVDSGVPIVGEDSSIAIGSDGLPVVSYYDRTNGDLKVLHCGNAACTGGNVAAALDTILTVGEFTSLAIGTDGFPVIAYRDPSNGDLKVLHCGNVTCTAGNVATAVDLSAPFLGYDTSIAIGTDGRPVVSYYDAGNGDLRVAYCGNAACSTGNVAITVDSAGTTGRFTSIAIGTDGVPVVAYHDETSGDLKLARPAVP